MQNAKQIWQETAKHLEKVYDRREAESISYILLEDVFSVSRTDILAEEMKAISSDRLEALLDRLLSNEPIQYVTGIADFYGRKFKIAQGALIPRPETEELCSLIINENTVENPSILDVGVGSGCIAITLDLELNGKIYGTDVSDEALEIARRNTSVLQSKVTLLKCDALRDDLPENNLDILVSNPPYIPLEDKVEMRENVLLFEPEIALFVPDNDHIVFYRKIADAGRRSLKEGGRLYFEIHERFGNDVVAYLKDVGYSTIEVHPDMHGKDRMISATYSTNR